jgi:hypothetical protein
VNSFTIQNAEGVNFAVAVNEVQNFLARLEHRFAQREPAPPAARCEAKVVFEGRNKANDSDLRALDLDCNGEAEIFAVTPDAAGAPVMLLVDMNEDGEPEGVVYDENRDGKWDVSYWDADGDSKPDIRGYHPDGESEPTSYGPYGVG